MFKTTISCSPLSGRGQVVSNQSIKCLNEQSKLILTNNYNCNNAVKDSVYFVVCCMQFLNQRMFSCTKFEEHMRHAIGTKQYILYCSWACSQGISESIFSIAGRFHLSLNVNGDWCSNSNPTYSNCWGKLIVPSCGNRFMQRFFVFA